MAENLNIPFDWNNTKVHPAIRYPSAWVQDVDDSEETVVFGLLDSFTPRIVTPKDVINSIGDGNQGFVSKHPEYYVDLNCKPYGRAFDLLLACQNGDRYFDVIFLPLDNYISSDVKEVGQPTGAWGPQKEVFIGCKITDSSTRYVMDGAPATTFSARALRYALRDKQFGDGKIGRTSTQSEIPGLGS